MQLDDIKLKIDEISIFRNKSKSNVFYHYTNLINGLNKDIHTVVNLWNIYYNALLEYNINVNIGDYIFEYVLTHQNSFSMACADGDYLDIMSSVIVAAKSDLERLQYLSKIKSVILRDSLAKKFSNEKGIISNLPIWINEPESYTLKENWSANITDVSEYYEQNGVANFALGNIFYINEKNKIVKSIIVEHKEELNNDSGILNMYVALDSILNGSSGNVLFKSVNSDVSNIMAMCIKDAKYSNIKVIQVTKKDLSGIDNLLLGLKNMPSKFILFIDNIENVMEQYYYTLKNCNGKNTLNMNNKNIFLATIGNCETFDYSKIFDEVITI